WALQPGIVAASLTGVDEAPKGPVDSRTQAPNPLVNTYKTADDRFIALCMLQGQRYWAAFCRAIGRAARAADERFDTAASRFTNRAECIALLDGIFASKPLAEWRGVLATQ